MQEGHQKQFFSLCGLSVDEDKLFIIERDLLSLKGTYEIDNFKELRKPPYTKEKKLECTKDIFKILNDNGARVISTILGPIALKNVDATNDYYFNAMSFLIERFYLHLEKSNKTGIIISDSVDRETEKLLRN